MIRPIFATLENGIRYNAQTHLSYKYENLYFKFFCVNFPYMHKEKTIEEKCWISILMLMCFFRVTNNNIFICVLSFTTENICFCLLWILGSWLLVFVVLKKRYLWHTHFDTWMLQQHCFDILLVVGRRIYSVWIQCYCIYLRGLLLVLCIFLFILFSHLRYMMVCLCIYGS